MPQAPSPGGQAGEVSPGSWARAHPGGGGVFTLKVGKEGYIALPLTKMGNF